MFKLRDTDYKPSVENILTVYRAASADDIREGLSWYADAHALAKQLSPKRVDIGAGVIASLSPQASWDYNVRLAVRAFNDGFASGQTGSNVGKADAIMAGADPYEILGFQGDRRSGEKVRNFFLNILDPQGNFSVTVDRHAHDIVVGQAIGQGKRPILGRKGGYDYLADYYRTASDTLGILPLQVQAITWISWRRLKGVG